MSSKSGAEDRVSIEMESISLLPKNLHQHTDLNNMRPVPRLTDLSDTSVPASPTPSLSSESRKQEEEKKKKMMMMNSSKSKVKFSSIDLGSEQLLPLLLKYEDRVKKLLPEDHDPSLFSRLRHNVLQAQDYATSLDFEGLRCSGVRSLLRYSQSYFQVMDRKKKTADVKSFLSVVAMLDTWFTYIAFQRNIGSYNASEFPVEARDYYSAVYCAFSPMGLKTMLGPEFHCCVFPSVRLPMSCLERAVIYVAGDGFCQRAKSLSLSRKAIADTVSRLAPTVRVTEAAAIIRLMDSPMIRTAYACMRSLTSKGRIVSVTPVTLRLETRVRIVIEDLDVRLKPVPEVGLQSNKNSVKFRLLRHGTPAPDMQHKLLVYVHGGAFVGPCAAVLDDFYVKEWAVGLQGVTILSMDHPHGPESPFPIGLQQLLDLWTWLTAAGNETAVAAVIGFVPQDIVLSGDSSGGSLVSSLLVILNEIRRSNGTPSSLLCHEPTFPKSVVLLFPKTTLQFDLFPSLMLSVFDSILNMQLLLGACVAYIPMVKLDENGNWNLITDRLSIPNDFLLRPEYKVIESPILSPIWYKDLAQVSAGLPLHLMAIASDPLLDESLALARKWTAAGPCHVHVIEGVAHGAFIYNYFSRVGSRCVTVAIDMFRRALTDT